MQFDVFLSTLISGLISEKYTHGLEAVLDPQPQHGPRACSGDLSSLTILKHLQTFTVMTPTMSDKYLFKLQFTDVFFFFCHSSILYFCIATFS